MISRRRKTIIAILTAELLIAIAIVMFVQTPSPPESQAAPIVPEIPPSLLVVPEVPFGTIAIALACFLALLVTLTRTKNEVT